MKIISKYRDYYDVVAYAYGGGDPKVRYERDIFKSTCVELSEHEAPHFKRYYSARNIIFSHLIVCDKWFTLYRDIDNYSAGMRLVTENSRDIFYELMPSWSKFWDEFVPGPIQGGERLLNLTRAVGNPVYIIDRFEGVRRKNNTQFHIVDHFTPLFDFGIQEYYPAEQIYQDLAYFVSNMMNDSPDLQPAGKPPQSDKEKILAHGMDLKTSFRGKR